MATKIIFSVVFLALVTVTSAQLWCMYGTTTNSGNTVSGYTSPEMCPGTNYCQKNYQKYNNYQQNSYGCGNTCTRSGCSENNYGSGTCCCRGNYCNSGFNFSKTAVSSMILTIVSSIYFYF